MMLVVVVWGNSVYSQHIEWLKSNLRLSYVERKDNEIQYMAVEGRGFCLFADDAEIDIFLLDLLEATSSDILTIVAVA